MKTVELIEEETPWIAAGAVYLVKIAHEETLLLSLHDRVAGRLEAE